MDLFLYARKIGEIEIAATAGQFPVFFLLSARGRDPHPGTGVELLDVPDNGMATAYRLEAEIIEQGVLVELFFHETAGKNGPYLGGEHQRIILTIIIKRFDAQRITRHENLAALAVVDDEGEHTPEVFDAGRTPLDIGRYQHFRIAGGAKLVVVNLPLDVLVVVDLTIEDDNIAARIIGKGLIGRARKIDDG